MSDDPYYRPDLAWIHHAGYSHHARNTGPGILRRLRAHGLGPGALVLDAGCGSGLLARQLVEAGYRVHGIDASPAMIDLARAEAPGAAFEVLALPTRRDAGEAGGLPAADAVVSTGHALNYLETREDIGLALGELARALRPGGLLAIDLMTERFRTTRDIAQVHGKVEDDWAILTRFSRPAPFRFDRHITVFRLAGGAWRRSDEWHRNLTFEADEALAILRENGVEARSCAAFGEEALPEGLVVIAGARR